MGQNLTPKQKQVLEWIEQYLSAHQTMPSRREIAEGLGLSSPATIQQHIEALESKGFLRRGETRESRALQWTARSKKLLAATSESVAKTQVSGVRMVELPLLGSIAAGYPIEVYTDAKSVAVPIELFISPKQAQALGENASGDIYMLTVRGDSMIEEGIFAGDWVILKKSSQARPGETVAALVNGESTLKKFFKTKTGVELHPANPNYPVIQVGQEDRFEVQGILLGVIRRCNQV